MNGKKLLMIGFVGIIALGLLTTAMAPVFFANERHFEQLTLTATGVAGAATGTVTSSQRIVGDILAVHIDYAAGISTTTDVTIATLSPSVNVLVRSDSATDGWFYPTVQHHNNAAATVTAYMSTPIHDSLTVAAAQSTSGTVATVTIFWKE